METLHAEGDSPFVSRGEDNASAGNKGSDDPPYAECPVDGCGELLLFDEMDYHIELHAGEAETDAEFSQIQSNCAQASGSSSSPSRSYRETERHRRTDKSVSNSQTKTISTWKRFLRMPASSSSSASSAVSSRHRKSPKATTVPADHATAKRLGVSLESQPLWDRLPDIVAEKSTRQTCARRSHA